MRENELTRHVRKRFRSTTKSDHDLPVAENLLNREFTVGTGIRVWVSDMTYIATADGINAQRMAEGGHISFRPWIAILQPRLPP